MLPALAATLLAAIHVLAGRLRGLDGVPRHALLSAGSGVSIAYVFLHLLPEVAASQEHLGEVARGPLLGLIETHAWLLALAGLVAIYAVEVLARRARRDGAPGARVRGVTEPRRDVVGWVGVGTYAAYNAVVGYLLVEQARRSTSSLVLFAVAMAVHFVVNDHGLEEHHGDLYRRVGRWVVAAGVLVGVVIASVSHVSEAALGATIAFLGGGIVMNVLKEELPAERQARLAPFLGGAVVYGLLLLAI